MAREDTESGRTQEHEGNGRRLGHVAAIAAASGATAFAARKAAKALSGHGHARNGTRKTERAGEAGRSLVGAAVSSGWDVAKTTLIPVVEDAAGRAGSYVAERAPELVRNVIVPRFIAGFERGRRGSRKREEPED